MGFSLFGSLSAEDKPKFANLLILKFANYHLPKGKNGQAPFIAPLQPFTLAAFPPWGSSKGAGRKRLARIKSRKKLQLSVAGYKMKCEIPIS